MKKTIKVKKKLTKLVLLEVSTDLLAKVIKKKALKGQKWKQIIEPALERYVR